MTVREHIYPTPSDDELHQMIGAAVPHFALQIRDRVAAAADALAQDDPRRATLEGHMRHLEALALGGEGGRAGQAELPTRPPLVITDDAAPTEAHA